MTARALGPIAACKGSWALLKKRPIATFSVSVALLTSLFAVCCGLGVLTAPWFMCELFALQIGVGIDEAPAPRSGAWLWAGLLQLIAVLVLCSLAFLTLLGLGPDVLLGGAMEGQQTANAQLTETLGLLFFAGGVAIALIVFFEHAPAILIDRGGTLSGALLESARLVAESGPARTWLTSATAHGLQLAPALTAVVLAISHGTLASTVLWGVLLFPWLALAIALGQGMVVSSYLALRHDVVFASRPIPLLDRGERTAPIWFGLLALVLSGPLAVSGSLLKPAPVAAGVLPIGATIVYTQRAEPELRELYLPDSALRVALGSDTVRVLASDGGGAGSLPLRTGRIERVRIARAEAPRASGVPHIRGELAYAIEVTPTAGPTLLTWIDDAGVRLDDSLARRFAHRVPPWLSILLMLCLGWAALWIALALPPQARMRQALARDPSPTQLRAYQRRALLACLSLAPATLLSLAIGVATGLR
jgi:hypothetical protein